MSEALFDLSTQYEEMLRMGVDLTGEDPVFFMRRRVAALRASLPAGCSPQRILDFGCGTGESSAYLAEVFPRSAVVGVDTSENAVRHAEQHYGSALVQFGLLERMRYERPFDLCYVNGVFHHIEPSERPDAVASIRAAINPGGVFGLFENNPWNPGTRMVMKRIPFDRDAKTLSYRETEALMRAGGFQIYCPTQFLFYFPRQLAFLRFLEPALVRLPLGGQYCVFGRNS